LFGKFQVNHRLGKGVDAEPQSSKVQWPPEAICGACRIGPGSTHGNADEEIEWNEEKVYTFLRKTYGQSIVTVTDEAETSGNKGDEAGHGKDENIITSATTAPIGAAVGIAVASCGFGVAACCWRGQQKRKRKHLRKR
jgi:thiol oxidase